MRFNEQEYLQSDQLGQYALGLLGPDEIADVERIAAAYPAVRLELDRLMQALNQYVSEECVTPSPALKSRVMMQLSQLGKPPAFGLNALPLINAYSDADQWQRTVASIKAPDNYRNLFVHILRQDGEAEQFLVWVKQMINPEIHHDERESFLILEGRCECSIEGGLVQLSVGDYLAVPVDLEHTVRVISDTPVKAIIQRLKIAA